MVTSHEEQTPLQEMAEGEYITPFENLLSEQIPEEGKSPQYLWPQVGIVRFRFSSEVPVIGEAVPDGRTLLAEVNLSNDGEKARFQKRLRVWVQDPSGNEFESDLPKYTDGHLEFSFPDRQSAKDSDGEYYANTFMGDDIPTLRFKTTQQWSMPGGQA